MPRKLLFIGMVLSLVVVAAQPAVAMKATDPSGDVAGPLDITAVALNWTDSMIKGKFVMAEPFTPGVFEFPGGSFDFHLHTKVTGDGQNDYQYNYWLSVWGYEGELYGSLTGGPNGEYEYIEQSKFSMPDDHTLRFSIARKKISGDKPGSKFSFWYLASYSDATICPAMCDDFAPDGDEVFTRKF